MSNDTTPAGIHMEGSSVVTVFAVLDHRSDDWSGSRFVHGPNWDAGQWTLVLLTDYDGYAFFLGTDLFNSRQPPGNSVVVVNFTDTVDVGGIKVVRTVSPVYGLGYMYLSDLTESWARPVV